MEGIIKSFLEQLKVGRKQAHKNLALYPLLMNWCGKAFFHVMAQGGVFTMI